MRPITARHGPLASFCGTLVWVDDPLPADPETLTDTLGRFQRSVGGAWQPACSLWAQHYFNTLLIPVLCLLADGGARSAATVRCITCPFSGRPLRFALGTAAGAETPLYDLVDRHVGTLIVDLQAVSRLSKRLLQESAARTVSWAVAEIARSDPTGAVAVAALFAARPDACALCLSDRDDANCRRRTCCLRDRLPGQLSCGAICPSAAKRVR